jgi:hypothetical protein
MKDESPPVKRINWREVNFANDEAAYGSRLMRSGIVDFPSWSERMIAKYGESVREQLWKIYAESETQAAAVDAMEQESRELLGPSVWRPLEDATWSSSQARENAMLPFRAIYNDLSTWPQRRLKCAVETIAILTVSRIFAEIKPLPEEIRDKCRKVTDTMAALEAAQEVSTVSLSGGIGQGKWELREAASQASFAAAEAGWGAIRAAWTLLELARTAAKAAVAAKILGASSDDVLRKACQIWIEAAKSYRN